MRWQWRWKLDKYECGGKPSKARQDLSPMEAFTNHHDSPQIPKFSDNPGPGFINPVRMSKQDTITLHNGTTALKDLTGTINQLGCALSWVTGWECKSLYGQVGYEGWLLAHVLQTRRGMDLFMHSSATSRLVRLISSSNFSPDGAVGVSPIIWHPIRNHIHHGCSAYWNENQCMTATQVFCIGNAVIRSIAELLHWLNRGPSTFPWCKCGWFYHACYQSNGNSAWPWINGSVDWNSWHDSDNLTLFKKISQGDSMWALQKEILALDFNWFCSSQANIFASESS